MPPESLFEDRQFWLSCGAILVLLLLSAFFSGSETALTAASRARLTALEKDGDHRARLVNQLRGNKERLIGALLLGNNLVNILASAMMAALMIRIFDEAGVALATLVMTLLVLIFGEVLPKTYAIHHADRAALAIAPLIRAIVWLLAPVTQAVTTVVRGVLWIFRVDIGQVSVGSSLEELRGAIELHQGAGEDIRQERAMLRSILDLADVEVCEIMIHRSAVTTLDAAAPPAQIVDEVLNSTFTRLPLWEGEPDNIIGVIHAKALLKQLRLEGGNIEKLDIRALATEPWFIPEATTLYDQLQAFRRRREHFALVVDEYGSLMGVVTLEDILEEIVGEISDETDMQVEGVRPQPNGSYIIDGQVTIRDLNREFDWDLPDDEDYSTIAGLVMYEARAIPDTGQTFAFHGFRFDIMRRTGNRLVLLRVVPPPDKQRKFKPLPRKEGEEAPPAPQSLPGAGDD